MASRRPLTIGLPPKMAGFTVILSNNFISSMLLAFLSSLFLLKL
jgi:hypothetical protein